MLHVLTGAQCNNNCAFCMESDRAGRSRHLGCQSPDDVRRMILGYSGRSEILFTSGEPTLAPELPDHIATAQQAGYRTIALITNARRLAYREYAARLVRNGLNRVTVSIHGHQAQIHDGLTRVRGSFAQTLAGLRNLAELKGRAPLELHSSTVAVTRNLAHIGPIHALLEQVGVDRMCFNVMMVKGRGQEQFSRLMARYRDIASSFASLAADIGTERARRVSLADIPRCTVAGLAFELVGDQERFEQFELLGSSGVARQSAEQLTELEAQAGERAKSAAALLARTDGDADLRGDADYYLTTRELKDNIMRVKRSECARCIHSDRCPGVWEVYVQHHGWDEFEPVVPAEP